MNKIMKKQDKKVNKKVSKKCCNNYNGTLDITDSCIFCKTYIGKPKSSFDIVDLYTVSGVPSSSLKRMCKEAKISYPKLMKFMRGQTCGIVGNEPLIYSWDIKRFINNLPVTD